jgi:hypothetical protein
MPILIVLVHRSTLHRDRPNEHERSIHLALYSTRGDPHPAMRAKEQMAELDPHGRRSSD